MSTCENNLPDGSLGTLTNASFMIGPRRPLTAGNAGELVSELGFRGFAQPKQVL
jgi:hypothetical protein